MRRLILLAFLVYPLLLFPDTLRKPFFYHLETITVRATGFHSEITVTGETSTSGTNIGFPLPLFSKIKEYQAFERKNTRMKRIRSLSYHLQSLSGYDVFYDESRTLAMFTLPENIFYKLHYVTDCTELMLLSFLSFNEFLADTTSYDLIVPTSLTLFYRLTDTSFLHSIYVDSTENDSVKRYHFKAITATIFKGYSVKQAYPFCTSRHRAPGIQMIIVPAEYKTNPAQYMNQWYGRQLKANIIPDKSTIRLIDSIAEGAVKSDSVISRLFRFARDNIRYINLYHGLETIIPKNVNEILDLRMGDCKDKANFLCQALTRKGFDAHLAICSTRNHPFDMDFPSFSGGNHVICVVRDSVDQRWIILDPTNPDGSGKRPGSLIEARTLFIIGWDGFPVPLIKTSVTENNDVRIRMNLREENGELRGNALFSFKGYSGDFLRGVLRRTGTINHKKFIIDYLYSLVKLNEYSGISTEVNDDSVIIKCHVKVPSSVITRNQGKSYIQIKFIPFIHGNLPEVGSDDLLIGYVISDQADITIDLQKPISVLKFTPAVISGDPAFSISAEYSGTKLNIHYSFRVKNIDLPLESQKKFYECMHRVERIFDDVIVVEAQP